MDYVVGSVAALISGNVTPNRPRIMKRALTPIKHQPSPNVTPKSQIVDDRSIFLSPTLQKKKAIVKKSPKRIFQNPDLDETLDEGSRSQSSPKADMVKKHLKHDLESDENLRSSKKTKGKYNICNESKSINDDSIRDTQNDNETTPKKKNKQNRNYRSSENIEHCDGKDILKEDVSVITNLEKTPKKKKKSSSDKIETMNIEQSNKQEEGMINLNNTKSTKKSRNTRALSEDIQESSNTDIITKENLAQLAEISKKKKLKKNKNKRKSKTTTIDDIKNIDEKSGNQDTDSHTEPISWKKKIKTVINPNAVTNKDTDSEHESDNEIESETEEANNEIFNKDPVDESSDEEQKKYTNSEMKKEKKEEVNTEDEIKRTLFVGNVPFSNKCKKEIKKIFNKYGIIETVRIRTVPVKDARVTPKLAVIKNELHPSRSTVNVYIKFSDPASIEKALAENNTVFNEHHLRVSRSARTGVEHDPKLAVFVGNMPFAIEDEVLRDKFAGCGEIDSVRIVRDRKTNAGKGFGYVNFTSKDAVELALGLSEEDLTIKNRILRVKRCTQITNNQAKRNASNNRGWSKSVQVTDRRQERFQSGQNIQRNDRSDGAYRRIMKRKNNQFQDANDGSPNKRAKNINQPSNEKKARKEFVGMTSEKKKKRKFDKGQKKKKALSEILTK